MLKTIAKKMLWIIVTVVLMNICTGLIEVLIQWQKSQHHYIVIAQPHVELASNLFGITLFLFLFSFMPKLSKLLEVLAYIAFTISVLSIFVLGFSYSAATATEVEKKWVFLSESTSWSEVQEIETSIKTVKKIATMNRGLTDAIQPIETVVSFTVKSPIGEVDVWEDASSNTELYKQIAHYNIPISYGSYPANFAQYATDYLGGDNEILRYLFNY